MTLGGCIHVPDDPDGIVLRDAPSWEDEAMTWGPDRFALIEEELAAWDRFLRRVE